MTTANQDTFERLRQANVGFRVNDLVNDIQAAIGKSGLTEVELAEMEQHAEMMKLEGEAEAFEGYSEMVETNGFTRLEMRIKLIRLAKDLAAMDLIAMKALMEVESANV